MSAPSSAGGEFDFRKRGKMPLHYSSWCERLYRRQVAVGQADIMADEIVFRFRDELFVFPTIIAALDSRAHGSFYLMPVKKARALQKTQEKAQYGLRRY